MDEEMDEENTEPPFTTRTGVLSPNFEAARYGFRAAQLRGTCQGKGDTIILTINLAVRDSRDLVIRSRLIL